MLKRFSLPKISQFQGWKQSILLRIVLFFVIGLMFYFTLVGHTVPSTYEIDPNTVSTMSIKSSTDLEDETATERAREAAAAAVKEQYTTLSISANDFIEEIYDQLEKVNTDEAFTRDDKLLIYQTFFDEHYESVYKKSIRNKISDNVQLDEQVSAQLTESKYLITADVYFKFLGLTAAEINDMELVTKDIVSKLLDDQIRFEDVDSAREEVAELVNASTLSFASQRELVQEIARFAIVPNTFYDEQASIIAVEEAQNNVEPVMIKKGDIIVKEGQVITEEIYRQLAALDLLSSDKNYWSELGLFIVVVLFVLAFVFFIRQSELPIQSNNAQLLMLVLIIAINLVIMNIVVIGQSINNYTIGFIAPIAVGSMLTTILIHRSLAYITAILFSITASIIYNVNPEILIFDYRYGFLAMVVSVVSIFCLHKAMQRSAILKGGLWIAFFGAMTTASMVIIGSDFTTEEIILAVTFSFASGIITAVLVIGLIPFFEICFGILSTLRLVELSNPNHPLLRKLLTEAPGTYHHSVMVANLSETAAEAIGANGLLCRVGSFYHDVGKTKRPSYFIENQVNIENPHDKIEPALSKSIIVSHAKDGVEMLKEYKLPKPICDIAEQHHGTTLLKYFYHKAIKEQEKLPESERIEITEEEYRYPGPNAQSKEAAIIGVADAVEAAVRSLRNPSMEQIDKMVDSIIQLRLDDHQFNECDITLKELDQVGKTLKEALLGIFHSRIEYPELPKKEKIQHKGVQVQ
ncbi:HD family phosphohydrolase [Longirhabdus pacifica]|uniref:HD family phosphohydrolase n=1 Tax=Longirhabdus pacifica TaxID=2305227 RepID=UPI001008846F|nr:HDIG domain-containing metalloprotein [Longirhabdus pacifica]